MVYMLFDNPDDKGEMQFLTEYAASINQIYPVQQCVSVKSMIKLCQVCIKNSSNEDTLICWYDFMGILCWWLCNLQRKKRRIVILNILLKDKDTVKNKFARLLYRPALNAKNVTSTVTSKEYGEWLNKRLKLNEKYILLHDIYHSGYIFMNQTQVQKGSVFCGGRNGRDWEFLLELARNLPDVQFNCVMSKENYARYLSFFEKNTHVKFDISQDDFLKELSESELVLMPLNTEAPAGLIAMFQAAANKKMIIASDTMTTREYLGKGRGCLCGKDVNEWVRKIKYYLKNATEAQERADEFWKFLKTECSETHYADTLKQLASIT